MGTASCSIPAAVGGWAACPAVRSTADGTARRKVRGRVVAGLECSEMGATYNLGIRGVVAALRRAWGWLMDTGYHPEQRYMRGSGR